MFNREEKGLVQGLSKWWIIWKQRNVKKVGKALKYKLRKCEVEAMDKIAEDLEDGVVNPDLSQLKIGTGPQLVIREELKRDRQNFLRLC